MNNTPQFSCSKASLGFLNFKITDYEYKFRILKIITFVVVIGYLVKLLSNHFTTSGPENLEKISDFEG